MREQNDEKYRLLYESSSEAIMILIPYGRFIACNPATIQMFYCKDEKEFISKTPAELSPEYQPDKQLSMGKAVKMMDIAMDKGQNTFEWVHKRLNGEEFPAIVTLTRMHWEGRDALQSIVKDISELKKTENKLKEAKEYVELVLNLIPSAVYTVDTSCKITSFNKKAEEITGYTADDIIGKECRIFAEDPCRGSCGLFTDEIKKPIIGRECIVIRKDGQRRIVYKNADLIRDAQGRIIAGIESFEDVTERRKIEDDLKKVYDELEDKVKQRTKELREKLDELERFRKATVDREFRMKELRDEIERLKGEK